MENEPEVTREQMHETRASLSEKLETLEQHVVDTMQGANTAVADTVENIKDAMHETMETVKDTFNLQLQVKRHPWGMVAGSLALGYLGGYVLFRSRSARPTANGWSQPAPPDSLQLTSQQPVQEVSPGPSQPGWLSGVNELFGTEITKVKGLAIGTVLSVVRDMITQSVPEQMKPELADVIDSITVKLGGEPIRGPVLKDGFFARGEEHQERNSPETTGPQGAIQRPTTVRQLTDDVRVVDTLVGRPRR